MKKYKKLRPRKALEIELRAFDSALGRLAAGISAGKISSEEFDQKFEGILNDAVQGKHSRRPATVRRALAKHDQREP